MKEDEAVRLLKSLLSDEGAEWTEEGGWLRFRSRHEAMLWETACRMADGAALLYGQYPFRCRDPDRARKLCDEINRQLVRGALFLAEDGHPVYRCRVELDDIYLAQERFTAALQYSAQVMTHFWGRLSG